MPGRTGCSGHAITQVRVKPNPAFAAGPVKSVAGLSRKRSPARSMSQWPASRRETDHAKNASLDTFLDASYKSKLLLVDFL